MDLYLMRHGTPLPTERDPEQGLSSHGIREVNRVAGFLARSGRRPARVYHSKKKRARETAEIAARLLRPEGIAEVREGLSPLDPVENIAREIQESREGMLIIGHLPHLAKLAALLLTGAEDPLFVEFQPASLICLRRSEPRAGWWVAWMVAPDLLENKEP